MNEGVNTGVEAALPLAGRWRHIVIEGPIGVGKSSLARRLAQHLGADLLLERPGDNPFLERFYADSSRFAFQTQLFFLFQRIDQYRELQQPGMFARPVVADFMFEKDRLFARLTLDDEEYRLYTLIHAQFAARVPPADLVIWLHADPQLLMQRIRQRGIAMEGAIEPDYLQRLGDIYAHYFEAEGATPVLAVDTSNFNPSGNDADFATLLGRLEAFVGPRESFDPHAGQGEPPSSSSGRAF